MQIERTVTLRGNLSDKTSVTTSDGGTYYNIDKSRVHGGTIFLSKEEAINLFQFIRDTHPDFMRSGE